MPAVPNIITGTYQIVADTSWRSSTNGKVYLNCDTSTGPVNIYLCSIADLGGFNNVEFNIVDLNDTAGTNNINVYPKALSGNTINGFASAKVDNNGGSAIVRVADATNWEFDEVGGTEVSSSVSVNKVAKGGATPGSLVDSQRTDDGTNITDAVSGSYARTVAVDDQKQIGNDQLALVGRDRLQQIGRDSFEQIAGDETRQINGTKAEIIGVDENRIVSGNKQEIIQGNEIKSVSGNESRSVGGTTGLTELVTGAVNQVSNSINDLSAGLMNGDAKDVKLYGLGSISFDSGDMAGINGGAGQCELSLYGMAVDGTLGLQAIVQNVVVNGLTSSTTITQIDDAGSGETFVGSILVSAGSGGVQLSVSGASSSGSPFIFILQAKSIRLATL